MSNRPNRRGRSRSAKGKGLDRAHQLPSKHGSTTRKAEVEGNKVSLTQVQFEGPLPPPALLREYDEIVPGFARRLLEEFETQGVHRRRIENVVIGANVRAQSRGQIIGMVCFLSLVAGAVALGLKGHDAAAIALAGIDVAGFGGALLWTRTKQSEERAQP